jgi:hypothetical protein
MRKWGATLIGGVMLIALLLPVSAVADDIQLCRIKVSERQTVSLGFPFRTERLKWLPKPKILVIPFQQKDNPSFVFTNSMRNDYLAAAENISNFSNGLSKIEFVFAPTISTELTNSDMDQLKINQREAWQKDESKSTYGFVRKFLADYDSRLDFTGINGVILAGSSTSSFSDIAEAFMFWNGPDAGWFRPMETAEGQINNAVLLDNHSSQATITHEIMHMYGLQDLYGTETGPGRLSLMASNEINLLSYEKWVLGWLPDSDVQCLSNVSQNSIYKISFDYTKVSQVLVIKADNNENYVVETTKVNGVRYIGFYSVDNDGRPPLTFFQERSQAQSGGTELEDFTVIGTQLKSPKYTLLVSSLDSTSIILHFASNTQTSSNEFKDLVTKSSELRSKLVQEAQDKARAVNEAKAAAELKAKQAADAKAAAELKAKQEADAKAAEALKAKQDAEAKAALAAAAKKSTITCTNGKVTKKVTAVNPKCPTGYKKK